MFFYVSALFDFASMLVFSVIVVVGCSCQSQLDGQQQLSCFVPNVTERNIDKNETHPFSNVQTVGRYNRVMEVLLFVLVWDSVTSLEREECGFTVKALHVGAVLSVYVSVLSILR